MPELTTSTVNKRRWHAESLPGLLRPRTVFCGDFGLFQPRSRSLECLLGRLFFLDYPLVSLLLRTPPGAVLGREMIEEAGTVLLVAQNERGQIVLSAVLFLSLSLSLSLPLSLALARTLSLVGPGFFAAKQLVVHPQLLRVRFRLGRLGPRGPSPCLALLLALLGVRLERRDIASGNGGVDDGAEPLVVVQRVAQYHRLVDLVHVARVLLEGDEQVVLFLVGALVLLCERFEGLGGYRVPEQLPVVIAPVEAVRVDDGLGRGAGGVVAFPPGGVGEDRIGQGDGLEFFVCFGFALGRDLV